MEQLNKIEVIGMVGRTSSTNIGGKECQRFTLCNNTSHTGADGIMVIDTLWLSVISWEGPQVEKGEWVKVTGRLRMNSYVNDAAIEVRVPEVIAQTVEILKI